MVITFLLKFSQLIHLKYFELLRESFIGKIIIVESFNWSNFIYYIIGFGISIIWLTILNKLQFK